MTFLDDQGIPNERDFALLVLGNDGNTGYVLVPVTSSLVTTAEEGLPPEHQLIFDSFELVAANSTTVTTISASPLSPFQLRRRGGTYSHDIEVPPQSCSTFCYLLTVFLFTLFLC